MHRAGGGRVLVATAVTFASTMAALVILGGGQALASHVDCGDTITADTTLDSDLIDCPNNGIVIGADGVTLNLREHVIDGDGTPAAGCDPKTEFCDFGVLNDGHDGVTVKRGSVREFALGVFVGMARRNKIRRISSSKHEFFGLFLGGSNRSLVRGSSFRRTIPPEGDGMGLFGCSHIRILGNSIRRNAGPGIHIEDSADNLIKGNFFSRNGPAILMEEADRNRVQRNRVRRGGGILVAPGNQNLIAGNRVSRAVESIGIDKGRGNRVKRNLVARARGKGIRLGIPRPPFGTIRSVVRRNRVRGSGEDGFAVFRKNRHSLLNGNRAIGSRDDGFDIGSRSTKLTGNRALRNADLGIEAVDGVIDGGGNVARGNGDPLQCTNIFCI